MGSHEDYTSHKASDISWQQLDHTPCHTVHQESAQCCLKPHTYTVSPISPQAIRLHETTRHMHFNRQSHWCTMTFTLSPFLSSDSGKMTTAYPKIPPEAHHAAASSARLTTLAGPIHAVLALQPACSQRIVSFTATQKFTGVDPTNLAI